jgi:hypothetical protein
MKNVRAVIKSFGFLMTLSQLLSLYYVAAVRPILRYNNQIVGRIDSLNLCTAAMAHI